MKFIIFSFRNDIVSTIILVLTVIFSILYITGYNEAGLFLFILIPFIFRGILWQGAYVKRIRELEKLIK